MFKQVLGGAIVALYCDIFVGWVITSGASVHRGFKHVQSLFSISAKISGLSKTGNETLSQFGLLSSRHHTKKVEEKITEASKDYLRYINQSPFGNVV